jgi:uncharacterized protein YdhG (YjbR/CyaY superfamily)
LPSSRSSKPKTESAGPRVRAYLAKQPLLQRAALKKIQAAIRSVAPKAEQVFSYGIPGYRLDGRPLMWYAGFKEHVSIYPIAASVQRTFAKELQGYGKSTGTVRFPLTEPPPIPLIKRLAKARITAIRSGMR